MNFKMRHQLQAVSRIFRRNQIHAAQRFHHAGRHIAQIADRCRTQI